MEIYFTRITLIVTVALSVFGRNIQRQVDNLERRYENDYVSMKENVRDLWKSIDQLETSCSAGIETSDETNNGISKVKESVTDTSTVHLSLLLHGFSEEKEFLRKSLNGITDSITKVQSSCNSSVSEKMNYISEIDAKCSNVEKQVEHLHKIQSSMSEKIEAMRQTMASEVDGLRFVINQALEEVMQNNILNKPESCIDMAKAGVTSSGVYTLHYRMQEFIVYCLMSESCGYTFISPETYINVDIASLSNDNSHVVIRHRRTNGLQYESRIEQISRYRSRPLSVQYNAHAGYKDVVNKKMTPYIYVGLNPLKLASGRSHKGDTQGYKSNGKDFTFVNCDGNPNGYFAFLFNHNKVAASRKVESSAISRKWIASSSRVTGDILPDKFMSSFELHFGGCGAYAGTNHMGEVTGAAVGIPYTLS